MKNIIIILMLISSTLFAHDLQYSVSKEGAVVAKLFFADESKFAFEGYEIYSLENNKVPFQVGRTDKLGRIAFLPDKEGKWLIKAISDDGHGITFDIYVDKSMTVQYIKKPLFERYSKVFTGAGLILGIFGILSLIMKLPRFKKRGSFSVKK